jgi:hypothetical protein
LKEKEATFPREQIDKSCNTQAEEFKKVESALRIANNMQALLHCTQASGEVDIIIMTAPGVSKPTQELPLRKKDF